MKEFWKDVHGYEGLYQVSTLGRVRSLPHLVNTKNGRILHFDGKIIKPIKTRGGYYTTFLCKNGVVERFRINRLVAMNFIPNPNQKPYVDHIDGCITNNCVCNLRWVTHVENMNNPATKYKRAKTVLQLKDGIIINIYPSVTDAKKSTGIAHVQSACAGERHTAGGYEWKYED